MSDYNPTYTVQWRDYETARKEQERWHRKVERLKKKGMDSFEAIYKAGHMATAPLITEERPNPLSMELRIVLAYFWEMYKDCLEGARSARERDSELRSDPGRVLGLQAADYERDAKEAVSYAQLLCHELFDVTSPHAPVHIHSEYGCNDEGCPAWKRGYEAAQENVLDWYSPD